MIIYFLTGTVPEWLMGADCKSVSTAYVGSNPTCPNNASSQQLEIKS